MLVLEGRKMLRLLMFFSAGDKPQPYIFEPYIFEQIFLRPNGNEDRAEARAAIEGGRQCL